MQKHLRSALAFVLLIPGWSRATVDISPVWDSVAFTAGRFRVEAEAMFPGNQMSDLRVWISGKRVQIPHSEFQQIANPELEKITVTEATGFPGSAWIEIPFLIENPSSSDGPLQDGGTWTFFLEGNKFTHKRLEPPQQKPASGS